MSRAVKAEIMKLSDISVPVASAVMFTTLSETLFLLL